MANGLLDDEELRRYNAQQVDQPWYARALPMEGRATLLPFRDTMPGSVFNKREIALPGLLAEAVNAFTAPSRSLLGTDPTFDPAKEGVNMAMNVMGGGVGTSKAMRSPTGQGGVDLAMNAYHGTPHDIKGGFDISKVGTGEGAQAYGHGMYFAENPSVAKEYIPKSGFPKWEDKEVKSYFPSGLVEFVDGSVTSIPDSKWAEFSKAMQSGPRTGNLYKVDIPDEQIPMMLDWDKPFTKQTKEVKEALKQSGIYKQYKQNLSDFSSPMSTRNKNMRGENIQSFVEYLAGSPEKASQMLSEIGIKGIRYLDEGSRSAGKGTSNFVVFDPATVKILQKNDIDIEELLKNGLLGN